MTKRRSKPKLPKKPKYELVSTDSQEGKEVRKLVNETVKAHHDHLRNAKIAIAWMVGQKKDKDGRLVLGRMKKASELDRELHEHDLVLLLNREMWKVFGEKQRTALVDHELCHADEALDPNGEAIEDAHGRKQYRIRKHDLEEFAAVPTGSASGRRTSRPSPPRWTRAARRTCSRRTVPPRLPSPSPRRFRRGRRRARAPPPEPNTQPKTPRFQGKTMTIAIQEIPLGQIHRRERA